MYFTLNKSNLTGELSVYMRGEAFKLTCGIQLCSVSLCLPQRTSSGIIALSASLDQLQQLNKSFNQNGNSVSFTMEMR